MLPPYAIDELVERFEKDVVMLYQGRKIDSSYEIKATEILGNLQCDITTY